MTLAKIKEVPFCIDIVLLYHVITLKFSVWFKTHNLKLIRICKYINIIIGQFNHWYEYLKVFLVYYLCINVPQCIFIFVTHLVRHCKASMNNCCLVIVLSHLVYQYTCFLCEARWRPVPSHNVHNPRLRTGRILKLGTQHKTMNVSGVLRVELKGSA